MMSEDEAIEILWAYHQLGHTLEAADLIIVLGSNDPRVALRAAELFHAGFASRIVFTGGKGRLTHVWDQTEAERFSAVARGAGVPDTAILLEPRATNTGENIRFTRDLLGTRGLTPSSALIVQKPYMERRAFAAFGAQWPELSVRVTSPRFSFREYITPELPRELVVATMVGDFQRIIEYPRLGFATEQPITPGAIQAFETLVRSGHGSQLVA
jgi:uncharacterized SAM-binding protein YcdF (DUF218 family)